MCISKQGFLVYPKCPYCMSVYLREASPLKDEKDAIRVHQKALHIKIHDFPKVGLKNQSGESFIW